MLGFKEYLNESVKFLKVRSSYENGPKIGSEFPVTIGDRSISAAANKLANNGEDPDKVRQAMRIIFNPENKKFYAWRAGKSLHKDIDIKLIPGVRETRYYTAFIKDKILQYSLESSRLHFGIDTDLPLEFKSLFQKYFKGMILRAIKFE